MSDNRWTVPVSQTATLRQTVEYAVKTALRDGSTTIRFVFVHSPEVQDDSGEQDRTIAQELLRHTEVWAQEDAEEFDHELTVETAELGADRYLFSPEDIAREIAEDALEFTPERIVLDPRYDPGIGAPLLRPLRHELERFERLTIEEAPIQRATRRGPLLKRTSVPQIGMLFLVSFAFYQVLGGVFDTFDIITGVISAAIVAVGLSQVTFTRDPTRRTLGRLVRHTIYIPYLLLEIIKSNIVVAAVILHPRLPIEPRLTRIRPAVWGSLPITTLSNSITLTPGTLTVRVDGRTLTVHTLIPDARQDLFDGGLERAVRFVYYGHRAAAIATPRERGDTALIDSTDEETLTEGTTDTDTSDNTNVDDQSNESDTGGER